MSKIIPLPNMQERYNRVERHKRETFRRTGKTEEQLAWERATKFPMSPMCRCVVRAIKEEI